MAHTFVSPIQSPFKVSKKIRQKKERDKRRLTTTSIYCTRRRKEKKRGPWVHAGRRTLRESAAVAENAHKIGKCVGQRNSTGSGLLLNSGQRTWRYTANHLYLFFWIILPFFVLGSRRNEITFYCGAEPSIGCIELTFNLNHIENKILLIILQNELYTIRGA